MVKEIGFGRGSVLVVLGLATSRRPGIVESCCLLTPLQVYSGSTKSLN